MGTFKPYLSKSGWAALARHQYTPNTLEQNLEVDFTVVGAGFAGLALARQLALLFPERQIALLDADEPMQNSSARNSGFMIEVPYTKINNQIKENEEQWQHALMQQGKDQLRDRRASRSGLRLEPNWSLQSSRYRIRGGRT